MLQFIRDTLYSPGLNFTGVGPPDGLDTKLPSLMFLPIWVEKGRAPILFPQLEFSSIAALTAIYNAKTGYLVSELPEVVCEGRIQADPVAGFMRANVPVLELTVASSARI